MIEDKTLNYVRFATGHNNLKMEELEAFTENEVEELNGYNSDLHFTVEDINTNQTLRAYVIQGLLLTLQTRWGNNLDYHVNKRTKYLNKLTGMQV